MIPIYEIFHSNYIKSSNLYWKMLISCGYIIFAYIFFIIISNELYFDYSAEI